MYDYLCEFWVKINVNICHLGERLELKISGVRAELYDSSGYLITEDKADDYFKTGMKLRVSSETAYPNIQPKEYIVTVE